MVNINLLHCLYVLFFTFWHQMQGLIENGARSQLERKDGASNARQAKPLWLVWVGENLPQLEEIGQLYLRRFAIAHWYRLAKQTLFWTQPQLSTTEQCDRWSTLMPLLTWQLWLAR